MKRNFSQRIVYILAITIFSIHSSATEYLVKYRQRESVGAMFALQMKMMEHLRTAQLIKVDITDENLINTLVQLSANANVEYIVPNYKLYAIKPIEAIIDSSYQLNALKDQWSIKKIKAEEAWLKAGSKGSKNVVIALIDTGADYKHKNLAPNMVKGYNFINKNEDPMDITSSENPGHGTHCAGIMGATGLVEDGIIGASPNLSIMPLRFLDENGSGNLDDGIKAIDYAISKKVDVISASWGAAVSRANAAPLIEAAKRAEAAGIVFVMAASNDGKNNDSFEVYPANSGTSNSISVAASNSQDQKPSWSNYGKLKVHLAAPGEKIMSTLPSDKFGELSGTSMATPLVAGLVAFIKSLDLNLNPVELRALLQATGDKVSIITACDCRVNALNAAQTVIEKIPFVAPYAAALGIGESLAFHLVYGVAPIRYESSNNEIASIDSNGLLTAKKEGEIQISATDANGQLYKSYNVTVGKPNDNGGGGGGGGPSDPSKCPFDDPQLCDILCQIQPSLPYCN